MANVLLISQKKYFIVSSLVRQLEDCGHVVTCVDNNPSEIERVKDDVDLIILYVEDVDIKGYVYLKDVLIETNIPLFVMGDTNQIEDVKTTIAEQFIKKQFPRPINLKEAAETIDGFLREDTNSYKRKILVVDDSGVALRSIKSWLENKYQVILANSGAMAIKCMVMKRPDLVLLDYEMPICDGRQVLEMIRAEEDFADIPVIFLTNKNDRESVCSVSALHPEGYLLKTMDPKQIVKSIDDFFDKKKWNF